MLFVFLKEREIKMEQNYIFKVGLNAVFAFAFTFLHFFFSFLLLHTRLGDNGYCSCEQ